MAAPAMRARPLLALLAVLVAGALLVWFQVGTGREARPRARAPAP
jgi:hypothetical protein